MGRPNFLKFRWEDGVAIAAVVLLAAAVILEQWLASQG